MSSTGTPRQQEKARTEGRAATGQRGGRRHGQATRGQESGDKGPTEGTHRQRPGHLEADSLDAGSVAARFEAGRERLGPGGVQPGGAVRGHLGASKSARGFRVLESGGSSGREVRHTQGPPWALLQWPARCPCPLSPLRTWPATPSQLGGLSRRPGRYVSQSCYLNH